MSPLTSGSVIDDNRYFRTILVKKKGVRLSNFHKYKTAATSTHTLRAHNKNVYCD